MLYSSTRLCGAQILNELRGVMSNGFEQYEIATITIWPLELPYMLDSTVIISINNDANLADLHLACTF